jgi:hypothetical protein
VTVTFRVIVVRVDHNLARQRLKRALWRNSLAGW